MTRRRALRWLFAAIALTAFVALQRPFLARSAARVLQPIGPSFDYWGSLAWIFFEDRWALTLCVLAVIYFFYRVVTASRDPG